MKLNKVIEIVRIKQEIQEVEEAYTSLLPKQIRSPGTAIHCSSHLGGYKK